MIKAIEINHPEIMIATTISGTAKPRPNSRCNSVKYEDMVASAIKPAITEAHPVTNKLFLVKDTPIIIIAIGEKMKNPKDT